MNLRLYIFPFLALALLACSTYSKQECTEFDWQDRGYLKAMSGRTQADGLAHFHNTCGKDHGIAPDQDKFELGYQKGLNIFCAPENAKEFGKTGGEYRRTCPEKSEEDFVKNYTIGFNSYLKNEVKRLTKENSDLEYEVSTLKSRVSDLESENSSLQSQTENGCL